MVTHRERLEKCLSNIKPDRTPVALWRHFPVDDQSPSRLASAILNFQQTFDFDLVKVTPASSYCIKDWGVKDEWRGAPEGTRDYVHRVVIRPDDWFKLFTLNPKEGSLGGQLECLDFLYSGLGPETPMIQTIFNPLAQAKNLVGNKDLLIHIRRYPEALHAGLEIITESTIRFIKSAIERGIAGVFFAVQHAQYSQLSSEEYSIFGRRYDLKVLEAAQSLWLNILHIHGQDIMFESLKDYPVQIINWHDKETIPSLSDGQAEFPGIVCGGLRRFDTLVLDTPEKVRVEAHEAIRDTGGKRFILGTGCVVPITAPYGNILSARQSVDIE